MWVRIADADESRGRLATTLPFAVVQFTQKFYAFSCATICCRWAGEKGARERESETDAQDKKALVRCLAKEERERERGGDGSGLLHAHILTWQRTCCLQRMLITFCANNSSKNNNSNNCKRGSEKFTHSTQLDAVCCRCCYRCCCLCCRFL